MKIEPNEERQRNLEALRKLLVDMADGTTLSWLELEQASGVRMDKRGRELFRCAMRKERREYEPIQGSGVRLSSPTNALGIVRLRDRRIAGAARRAGKADVRIQARHLEQLPQEDRQEVVMRSALRGALLSGSRGLTRIKAPTAQALPPQLPSNVRTK